MQACPRPTKPTGEAGSSSVTLRNSAAATSKCRSLSAFRPATRCCMASDEVVCHASERNKIVRITAAPVHVFRGIDLLRCRLVRDVSLKARTLRFWQTWHFPVRSATAYRLRIRNFPPWWRSESGHSPAPAHPDRHDYCACPEG